MRWLVLVQRQVDWTKRQDKAGICRLQRFDKSRDDGVHVGASVGSSMARDFSVGGDCVSLEFVGKLQDIRKDGGAMMTRIGMTVAMFGVMVSSAVCVAQAPAAAPVGPAAEVQAAYNRIKPNVLKAA